MAKSPAKFQVYGLKENYIDVGSHHFKVVISPRFKSGADFAVRLIDADGKEMDFSVSYWGRKLNVDFKITPDTPDGLATAYVQRAGELVGQFNFWCIK